MGEGIVGFGSNGDIPMATVTAGTGVISAFPIPLVIDELPEIGAKSARFAAHHAEVVGEAAQFLVRTFGDYSVGPLKFLYGNSAEVLGTRGLTDGHLKVFADYGTPGKVMDDLAASSVTISTVERTADGSLARVVKNVPGKGDISVKVKFVEKGGQLQFIEKVSDDTAAREYQELINVKIYRDGLSPQEAASQVLSEKGTLDQYRLQNKLDLKSNAGWLGEGIAKQDLFQRDGITLLGAKQGFYKTLPNQNGFDHIYIDAQGNYVIVESKCLQDGGSVGKGVLPLDGDIREMDDNWISTRIDSMERDNLISHELAENLRTARQEGKIRKELYVTQNVPVTGNVVVDSLMDDTLSINRANICKLGVWEYG